jgi:hypothetical protein
MKIGEDGRTPPKPPGLSAIFEGGCLAITVGGRLAAPPGGGGSHAVGVSAGAMPGGGASLPEVINLPTDRAAAVGAVAAGFVWGVPVSRSRQRRRGEENGAGCYLGP